MQKAFLYTADGQKQDVYLLDNQEVSSLKEDRKSNFKEHLYIGYLVVATAAFGLGLLLTLKKLNGK